MARWRRARACRPTSSRRPGARTSVLSRTPFRTRPSPRPSTICGPPSRQRRQPHSGRQCCRAGMLGSEREEVAAACRRLAAEGLVLGTAGNVSARAGSHVAISATGAVLADATPDQVTVVDLEGQVVDGQLAPTSELDLHLGVYHRYDAGAVVHTHAPTATALSCVLDDELPCVHYSMLLLGGAVKVAPYATFGTPELAESVLDALEGRAAALMANHGANVRGAGAVGVDAVGDMLLALLERDAVDTSLLLRREEVQTSASVLPIRPTGERPAFHVVGANATYGPDDAPWDEIAAATHLHIGGPEFMGGEAAARILHHARENGVTTSADVLAPGDPGLLEWIAPALPELDYLIPNDEQVLGFTGASELQEGCSALVERGVGCVAATRGADGVLIVDADGSDAVPAFEIEVVDTTGCGDAFSAGFLRGLSLGRGRGEAAALGCATAAAKGVAGADGLPCAAVPTTLSGSPMTRLHRMPAGVEFWNLVRPSVVVAEPELMASQPPEARAASAMNALAHAAEALYGPVANPVSELAALRAAALLAEGIEATEETQARHSLALGAILAGYAVGAAGFALHHLLGQTLVRVTRAPHAKAYAVLLPHTVSAMASRAPEAVAKLAGALGAEPLPAAAPDRIAGLAAHSGVTRLSEVG